MSIGFDHLLRGTDESTWAASGLDGVPPLDAVGPDDRVVLLVAHPDDETLGAGGFIAASIDSGAQVDVVVATDGDASHPHSPTHTAEQLAAIRRAELTAAMAALDPRIGVSFLGLPDGGLAEHGDELTSWLAAHLDGVTLVVTPWAHDAHPDHEACARAGGAFTDRVRHWQFPIWAWHWGSPADLPWPALRRLELTPALRARKDAALACHQSQHSPLSPAEGDEAILPPNILAHFQRSFETFIVAAEAPAGRTAYFDALYAASADPWGLANTFYEQRKRQILLASLPRPNFRRAFEPGCATGLLTAALADRCDEVVAWDVAASAVAQTRDRIADRRVVIEQRGVPAEWPDGRFDLVVLSEVGYYAADPAELAARAWAGLDDDGVLVACHWRHPARDHAQSADIVHETLGAGRHLLVAHHEEDFRLDVWSASPGSVARSAGLVG